MEQLIESLKKVPMFGALRPEYLEMLAKLANVRTYKKSEVIIKQGDPGTGPFYHC